MSDIKSDPNLEYIRKALIVNGVADHVYSWIENEIQRLTKERDDAQMLADFNHTQFGIQCAYARDLEEKLATANSRIEVQRVNIEALQGASEW